MIEEVITMFLYVIFLIFFFYTPYYFIRKNMEWEKRKKIFGSGLVVIIFLLLFHGYVSLNLRKIRHKFNYVATSHVANVVVNNDLTRSLDYLGEIREVLRERDKTLSQLHAKRIGNWRIISGSGVGRDIVTHTASVYIPWFTNNLNNLRRKQ